jgi:phage-related protein
MNITYNNKTPEDYDCWLATRPVITPSEGTRDRYQIPGRRGELIGKYETRGNAKITFTLHQRKTSSTTHSLNSAMTWLRQPGKLKFSDDSDYFYEVVNAEATEYQNLADDYKRIVVEMEVYPFKYRDVYEMSIASSPKTFTLDSDVCFPLFTVATNATMTLTVNGSSISIINTNSSYIEIDTRDLIVTPAENRVSGDYSKLTLKNGSNTISYSGGMVLLMVNTREGYII